MNNQLANNFVTAQAPLSMAPPASAAGAPNSANNNDNGTNTNNGGAANAAALANLQSMAGLQGMNNMVAAMNNNSSNNNMGGGLPGMGGAAGLSELDQLQQAYNRTGDRSNSQHHPIAEFLYQLTKMLTDDNSEIIEWVDGRIKVHYPERLEGEVLHKYFRHSKFASFQRQLNYFGFRKIAGKGKMSPCSYVNEAATSDIRSLLLIKRKTNGSAARKAAMAQRSMQLPPGVSHDLRANLSALAAGAAAATGAGQQVNRLNAQAFNNAAALFGQQAPVGAAGLGQFPGLQQKSALGSNLFLSNEMSFLMSGQKPPSAENLLQQQQGMTKTPSAPSIEQLHAQLAASLANRQQQQNFFNPQLNGGSLGSMGGLASAALNNNSAAPGNNNGNGNSAPAPGGPASAALNATAALNNLQQQQNGGGGGPASAALNAAGAGGNVGFDSAANLKNLVESQAAAAGAGQSSQLGASAASQQLLNARLPSSNTLFPDSLSTASFSNLLASSNRLSSLLSLNSFLSRDPSVADLVGVLPQNAQQQFAANQAAAAGMHGGAFGAPR